MTINIVDQLERTLRIKNLDILKSNQKIHQMKLIFVLSLILSVVCLYQHSISAATYQGKDSNKIWLTKILNRAEKIQVLFKSLLIKPSMKCIWSFCIRPEAKYANHRHKTTEPHVVIKDKNLNYVIDF